MKLHDLARSIEVDGLQPQADAVGGASKEIVIDFRKVDQYKKLADAMKADFDSGMSVDEIVAKHGYSFTTYDKAMDYWHDERGLPGPDGRSLRGRLNRPRTSEKLRDDVMRLWHDYVEIQQIAQQLGCGRDAVREAVADWHVEKGLPVPDGRTRRRKICEKKQQDRDADAA